MSLIQSFVVLGGIAVVAFLTARTTTPIARGDDATSIVKKLKQEKVAVLKEIFESASEAHKNGFGTGGRVWEAKRDLLIAQIDLCETKNERIRVLKELVQHTEERVQAMESLLQRGQVKKPEFLAVKLLLLNVKIALEKENENDQQTGAYMNARLSQLP